MNSCNVITCNNKHFALGFCNLHYQRFRKYGDPNRIYINRMCSIINCKKKHYGHGFCFKHMWDYYKSKLYIVLGGAKCVKCGFSDIRALQFDHINGGGLLDVKKRGGNREMYRFYLKHEKTAKSTLQVLCANCNWIKRSINNENKGQHVT